MDNDELDIKDVLEIKEEVIQEFDPTNFIFDDEQPDDSRDGPSGEINQADLSLSNEETDQIVEHMCRECNTTFKRRKNLEEHLKFCRLSSEYHLRKAEMLKNLEQIEKNAAIMEAKNMCFCCDESYNLESFHIGQIKCTDCLKSFKSQTIYERHIFITHSELNDFPCTICNAKLRSESLLKLHVNQHQKCGKLYACKKCNKEFNCAEYLRRHHRKSMCSQKDSPLVCKECKKTFFGLDNIRAHIRSHHIGAQPSKKIEFMCPICKKCLSNVPNLNIHMRGHTGECPFDCDLCDKKFKSLELLRRHRRHHTGEKPYVCKENDKETEEHSEESISEENIYLEVEEQSTSSKKRCNQSFGSVSNLSRHMKRHTGERPFVCSVCKKGYISKAQLKTHMKIHIKKPYIKCEICNEQLKTEKALERHQKVRHSTIIRHHEAAYFKCNVCLNPFWTKQHLDKHMELGCSLKYKKRKYDIRRSQAPTYERTDCVICKKNFNTSTTLRSHLAMEHKVDPEDYIKADINNDTEIAMEPKVFTLEEKQALKTTNTESTNDYDSVVITSIIYKCESNSPNEIILDTCTDNINSVDDDGNDLEENSSNEHEFNINTYSSNDDDEESAKKFKYDEDSSEVVKFNINTDGSVLVQEFKVDELPSTSSKIHSDAEIVNHEYNVDSNIIKIKTKSA